jgi:ribonuclease E
MTNKMLIDATHPEETRVVVLRGNRVEEFDFESAQRKQLRGNIYLAKVTRVEPSLQAAFVDYGGNRHGFLAFSEIHPDYYQIPVADRQALIDEEERAQRAADDEVDRRSRRHRHRGRQPAPRRDDVMRSEHAEAPAGDTAAADHLPASASDTEESSFVGETTREPFGESDDTAKRDVAAPPAEPEPPATSAEMALPMPWDASFVDASADEPDLPTPDLPSPEIAAANDHVGLESDEAEGFVGTDDEADVAATDSSAEHDDAHESAEHDEAHENAERHDIDDNGDDEDTAEEIVESVGGADALEEVPDRAPRYRRQYKIQEVIKRRQVMLVQVVKEERGTKGAALTTYLSLAGRYSVLMPNTARGGGISRKITNSEDRGRLKEVVQELEVPEGMGVILRTAGASRTKTEIKRDFEYLLRLWETVRDLTLKSTAPKLVYEEGSLVKRAIRDLYNKEMDEVTVAGPEAYQEAKDFMRMLMPSHAKDVKLYADTQPLLSRYGVESQLDAMFSPVVQLRSGGYIVLNQAEALVAIDVNSGRATREHHIEDTALKTNLEASEEIARQLRLRDLAGLIVIDYIDMDEKRNNRAVERRLKECLKQDRARIQVGRISHFGLLEMSRQRIRTSVLESSTEKCPYCGGSGHVRSVSSLALQVLRALEEQLIKGATHNLIARTRRDVALYVLNQKRAHLRSLEERFAITITIVADDTVTAPQAFVIERGELVHSVEAAKALADRVQPLAAPLEEDDDLDDVAVVEDEETEAAPASIAPEQAEAGARRRRRRGRRRGRNGDEPRSSEQPQEDAVDSTHEPSAQLGGEDEGADLQAETEEQAEHGDREPRGDRAEARGDGEHRRRRRGRRGGRRNRHDTANETHDGNAHAPQPEFASAEEMTPPAAAQSEMHEIVDDVDAPSVAAAQPQPAPPPQVETPEPTAPPVAAESPRRRSTVREPAPAGRSEAAPPPSVEPAASPSPEPAVSQDDKVEETNRPRRTGWWSRRFAGG